MDVANKLKLYNKFLEQHNAVFLVTIFTLTDAQSQQKSIINYKFYVERKIRQLIKNA